MFIIFSLNIALTSFIETNFILLKFFKLKFKIYVRNGKEWYFHSQGEKWLTEERGHNFPPRRFHPVIF